MYETSLLETCGIAFAVVFGVLSILAIVIHLITLAFPAEDKPATSTDPASLPESTQPDPDLAVVVAISTAVSALIPGAKVSRVEEERS